MDSEQITHTNILRVLSAGFTLVIVLLLIAGFIGIRNIQSIKQNAASLVKEQSVTNRLIAEIQRQQVTLSEVFDKLAGDPESIDPDRIEMQLDEADGNISRIVAAAGETPERHLWQEYKAASAAFSSEARRLLELDTEETLASRDLLRRHEQVISVIAKLIGASFQKVIAAQNQIDRRSERLVKQSVILLGSCLVFAVLCTILTVKVTTELFRKMEWQTGELSRVSWHMLENQETTARRFSHELHDELGQSLTAVKANLSALELGFDKARLVDCLQLVDEAIGNVRQLAQLLRPTILDDFGLDAGIRWLCEGFTNRTGIEVEVTSNLQGRLPDETETHLFRIAQEALTNVARHSGATRVSVDLQSANDQVRLCISDNGRGLGSAESRQTESLGMIGMRARARGAGGELTLRTAKTGGLAIEVRVPAGGAKHERKDPHLVG